MREIPRDEGQDQDRLRDDASVIMFGAAIYGNIGVELLLGHVFGGIRFEGEQKGEEVHW